MVHRTTLMHIWWAMLVEASLGHVLAISLQKLHENEKIFRRDQYHLKMTNEKQQSYPSTVRKFFRVFHLPKMKRKTTFNIAVCKLIKQ